MPTTSPLQRAVRGDTDALQGVLREWWPRIQRWCRLQHPQAPRFDDACQESVVRVLRFIHRYDPDRPFGPWLRTVVANACRDLNRDVRRQPDALTADVSTFPDLDRTLDLQRAADRAIEHFATLTPRQQLLITRIDVRGESAAEVARELGLSAGGVRNQLHTARRALRVVLLRDPNVVDLVRNV
jgi:RNA polymerase sigma-70 factor (ECF subfamily)